MEETRLQNYLHISTEEWGNLNINDKTGLISLYESTNGPNWTEGLGYGPGDLIYCEIENNRVVKLRLIYCEMTGKII